MNELATHPDQPDRIPALTEPWKRLTRRGNAAVRFVRPTLVKYSPHALILGVVVIAAWIARPGVWDWVPAQIAVETPIATPTPFAPPAASSPLLALPAGASDFAIDRDINLHTDFPTRPRSDVLLYTVQKGDTLFAIATKFNLNPETILWSNYDVLKDEPDMISPGQALYILPVNGVYYQWQEGDRLDVIAGSFGVSPSEIILWPGNNLNPTIDVISPGISRGTWIIIPDGHREFKQWRVPILRRTDKTFWSYGGSGACQGPFLSDVVGESAWAWPADSHWLSGTHFTSYHPAIDLHVVLGGNVYAAASGVVVFAGWNNWGYGNLLVIDHGNGWQTVYAHLEGFAFGCGANVYQGSVVAYGGSTGNSTGPHLHFEMMNDKLGKVNPLDYLP